MTGVETEKEGAVIGCFDYNGKTVLYVVNHDKKREQKITLKFDAIYKLHLLAAECDEEFIEQVLELKLAAGAAILIEVAEKGKEDSYVEL